MKLLMFQARRFWFRPFSKTLAERGMPAVRRR